MSKKVPAIRLADLLSLAWGGLRRNKLRSGLTVGAIAFGVAVLVYLIALGLGLRDLTIGSVSRSSTLLSFTVTSAKRDIKPLNAESIQAIKSLENIKSVLPRLTLTGEVAFANKRAQVTVVGVDPGYFNVDDRARIATGVSFNEGDTTKMLVSRQFLRQYGLDTKKTPQITFDVLINNEQFGSAIKPISGVSVRGIVNDDNAAVVYMPRQYLEELLGKTPFDYEHFKVLIAESAGVSAIQPASEQVISQGYKVQTVVDTVDQINIVFSYITWTLGVLGGIAIMVASIGMFNTLTVSLLERTKEIGIMKALGVRRKDVRRIFIAEALLIGFIGGITGIVIAYALQASTILIFQFLALLTPDGKVPTLFLNQPLLLIGSLLFSLVIAMLTGIYPANRAAKLNPIDAIRHD
jgi:putative ABC transport system permease protein